MVRSLHYYYPANTETDIRYIPCAR